MGGSGRMMEFLELGYPTVATLNLSRPDLLGSKRQRDCFWQTLGSGKPRGLSQTPETGQARLRFENTVLIFLMKARSRAQLVMAVPSLIDFCRPAKDG